MVLLSITRLEKELTKGMGRWHKERLKEKLQGRNVKTIEPDLLGETNIWK